MEKKTRAAEVMGGKRSKTDAKPTKKAKGMHIRKANGGYIANHQYEPPDEAQDHVVPGDIQALLSHVGQHMQGEEDAGPPQGA